MKASELHSGDLLYWRGTGLLNAIIRWASRPSFWRFWEPAPYSHVAVFWRNGSAAQFIEAHRKQGVRVANLTDDPPGFAQHTHTAWPQNAALLVDDVGKSYSTKTAVAVIFGLCGKGTAAFMCSELAQHILSQCGWDFKGKKYHPHGLSRAIKDAGGFFVEPLEV